mmetsp:Transcript_14895/g.26922  ORF Transcript_14895/g.26922 Transcript_14895/m.26922 type:complete len:244 (-) Transcript_14895:143-874(-)
MTQKFNPPPTTFRGSIDQPRHIRHNNTIPILVLYRPHQRMQRRKRIRRNLRPRPAHGREQARLARVRKSDQSHVGDQFQFKLEVRAFSFSRDGFFGHVRSDAGGVRTVRVGHVAHAGASSVRDEEGGVGFVEIGDECRFAHARMALILLGVGGIGEDFVFGGSFGCGPVEHPVLGAYSRVDYLVVVGGLAAGSFLVSSLLFFGLRYPFIVGVEIFFFFFFFVYCFIGFVMVGGVDVLVIFILI